MATCLKCESDYSDRRKALGYELCLTCGEQHAAILTKEKSTRIMPGHKSNYMLLSGDLKLALQEAKGMSSKTSN
jgi:hypothetical protein